MLIVLLLWVYAKKTKREKKREKEKTKGKQAYFIKPPVFVNREI
jgi:hypothetical protein